MDTPEITPTAEAATDVHHKIGQLTRQLHDSLNELGFAEKLRGSMGELPDAQSRLSYIARLTGEAAEKVLSRVELAKAQHDFIASETRRVVDSLVKDPVAAVAKGEIFNFHLGRGTRHERSRRSPDRDHDGAGLPRPDRPGDCQVVNLAATIEDQLVQLLIQTAPANAPTASYPRQNHCKARWWIPKHRTW